MPVGTPPAGKDAVHLRVPDALMDDETRRLLEEAHKAEQRGEIDAAIRGYLRADLLDEAVRLLVATQRFLHAGQVLVRALGVAPSRAGSLDATGRQRARAAAQHLARGGDAVGAAELYAALGEHARGIDLLERAGDAANARSLRAAMERKAPWEPRRAEAEGALARAQALEAQRRYEDALKAYDEARRPGDAARMAVTLGRWSQAGELYLLAGNPYDASKCFAKVGDLDRCLAALMQVPVDHAGYRKSAVRAAAVAAQRGTMDFALDRFVAAFTARPPENAEECEAFYVLARLYQAGGHSDSAREVLTRLLAADPKYRDAPARLAQLQADARATPMAFERLVKEDLAFQGVAPGGRLSLPDALPEFPDLPPLPPAAPHAPPAAPHAPVVAAPPVRAAGISGEVAAHTLNLAGQRPRAAGVSGEVAAYTPNPSAQRPPAAPAPPPAPTPAAPLVPEGTEEALAPGGILNGRYRIEAQIGQGGMAAVYRAFDLELEELVAIKVFGLALDDAQLVQRFKQEVSLSRQLTHPNIVRLHDLGLWSGRRFITMELLEGQSLTDWMRAVVPIATGLRVMIQACTALGVAHQAGVVHRDVKPDNFFVTRAGIVKLMDFGIAKRRTEPTKTAAGFTAGTPAYIAPEQISDFTGATHLADLYAVGAMMYELFTGRLPFEHQDLMPLLMAHMKEVPRAPTEHRADLPGELNALILQLMEKDPAARPQSAEEVVRRMRAVLAAVSPR